MLTFVCVGVAALSSYAISRNAQRNNVGELVELGGSFRIGRGPVNHIQVWYDDDLAWCTSEGRYALESSLGTERGVNNWVGEWLGKDYAYSPVAIEVIKFDFSDRPLLDTAIVDKIRGLRSVRQIAIRGFMMDDKNVPSKVVDDFIKTTFPDLVNASPQ